MEKPSSAESKVYNGVPDEGISVQKLAEKTGFAHEDNLQTSERTEGKEASIH